jgi:hypothetical protein
MCNVVDHIAVLKKAVASASITRFLAVSIIKIKKNPYQTIFVKKFF